MSIEDNKELVLDYLRRFSSGDIEHSHELLADDFT